MVMFIMGDQKNKIIKIFSRVLYMNNNHDYPDFEKELNNNFNKYKFDPTQFKEGFSNFETFAPFGNYEHLTSQPQDINSSNLIIDTSEDVASPSNTLEDIDTITATPSVDETPPAESSTQLSGSVITTDIDNNEDVEEDVEEDNNENDNENVEAQPEPSNSNTSLSTTDIIDSESDVDEVDEVDVEEESTSELVHDILSEEDDEDFLTKYKFFIIIILIGLVVALTSSNY